MLGISTHWNWEKGKLNVMSTNSGVRHCTSYSSVKLGLVSHVLKVEKLRLEQLVQTHTAGKLRGWDQRPHTVFVRFSSLELLKTSLPAGSRPPPTMPREHTSQSGEDSSDFKSFAQFSP